MKHNKHKPTGIESYLRTKSKRYWAGAGRNKVPHGTRKRDRGYPIWYTLPMMAEGKGHSRNEVVIFDELAHYSKADIERSMALYEAYVKEGLYT